MAEINYKEINKYLQKIGNSPKKSSFASVYLIYGDEFLSKSAFEKLLNAIVPISKRDFCYEPFDGGGENISEVIQSLYTFPILSGSKAVGICESTIFHSKSDADSLIVKAKKAYDKNEIKKAAKYLVSFLNLLAISFKEISEENRDKHLSGAANIIKDDAWLDTLIDYCKDNDITTTKNINMTSVLQKVIEKGFCKTNHLIITTEVVDKRSRLYKFIKKNGVIIDCFVPKGDRWADKKVQESVISEQMKAVLANNKKTMDKAAYLELYEMTGFDLRTFTNNLEKLINYVGTRQQITIDDVKLILKRTKKNQIFEFTNAVADRNVNQSLILFKFLITAGYAPLMILGAIANQIRKLLLVKAFSKSSYGEKWHADMQYDMFQNHILPNIDKYDNNTLQLLDDWENMLSKTEEVDSKRKKKKKKQQTDLLISKNPYAVYQTLKKSENFSTGDLLNALEYLCDADLRIKSTSQDKKLVMEEVIIKICLPVNQ